MQPLETLWWPENLPAFAIDLDARESVNHWVGDLMLRGFKQGDTLRFIAEDVMSRFLLIFENGKYRTEPEEVKVNFGAQISTKEGHIAASVDELIAVIGVSPGVSYATYACRVGIYSAMQMQLMDHGFKCIGVMQ